MFSQMISVVLRNWPSFDGSTLSVHIRRPISHSHMTYAETIPIEFKSGPNYVKHTIRHLRYTGFGKLNV